MNIHERTMRTAWACAHAGVGMQIIICVAISSSLGGMRYCEHSGRRWHLLEVVGGWVEEEARATLASVWDLSLSQARDLLPFFGASFEPPSSITVAVYVPIVVLNGCMRMSARPSRLVLGRASAVLQSLCRASDSVAVRRAVCR